VRHLVLIPSYNPGPAVDATVRSARAAWTPVWVVVDGSTDGSAERLEAMAATDPGLVVLRLPENRGKGAAVLHAAEKAFAAGFTHALTMDSDGQHPAHLIEPFMRASMATPHAMVLGRPVFDADAPLVRVRGRKISNGMTHAWTLGAGIGDSLFGFRVYPLGALLRAMKSTSFARRFDFDTEAAVRMAWSGTTPINIDAPVRYPRKEDGGVSHFQYGRDNVLLAGMHTRLMLGGLLRMPVLAWRRLRRLPPFDRPAR
jgi:hypothetical protein